NPSFTPEDAHTRWVDLNGDGLTDAFRLTGTQASWWRNLGDGFAPAESLDLPPGGTTLDFADARVKLADINGDGLLDLLFVRAGSILAWPSMGFGRFDVPRAIGNAPDVGGAEESRL